MAERWMPCSRERLTLGVRRYLGSCWACFKYLGAFAWLRPELTNKFAQGTLALQDELGYRSTLIPQAEVWELFPGIETVEIKIGRLFPDEGSSISYHEMVVLCSIVRLSEARTVFEIGTSLGVTAFNIALNLPEEGVLYTLDLPLAGADGESVKTAYDVSISDRKMIFADRQPRRFLSSTVKGRVSQLYGDSANFDYSPHKGRCDLVLVDGAHSLPYVESDTRAAFQLVRPGGLVVWHDYNNGFFWPDVHSYLTQFARHRVIHRIRGTMLAIARAPSAGSAAPAGGSNGLL